MELSLFGEKFSSKSGIRELMDDLSEALSGGTKQFMLGGGNPAHIPKIGRLWERRMREILHHREAFEAIHPVWNENIILVMSLSKLGLPAVRTGIVIAREEVISAISAMNAVVSLSSGSIGQAVTFSMVWRKPGATGMSVSA